MALEAAAAGFELGPEVAGVVDLAIIGEDAGAAARHHGLGAGGRKIDDGEARVAEHDPGFGVRPDAARVRAAMVERRRHGAPKRFKLLSTGAALEVHEASDTAHGSDLYRHPVIRDFPARRVKRRPLRRILAERRVGIVDVNENLAADPEIGEGGDGAIATRHVHMTDPIAGLVHQPLHDHLVIGVEGAVEEQERRAGKPCPQASSSLAQFGT